MRTKTRTVGRTLNNRKKGNERVEEDFYFFNTYKTSYTLSSSSLGEKNSIRLSFFFFVSLESTPSPWKVVASKTLPFSLPRQQP